MSALTITNQTIDDLSRLAESHQMIWEGADISGTWSNDIAKNLARVARGETFDDYFSNYDGAEYLLRHHAGGQWTLYKLKGMNADSFVLPGNANTSNLLDQVGRQVHRNLLVDFLSREIVK